MSEEGVDYFTLFKEVFDPKNRGFIVPAEIEASLIANGYLDEKNSVMDLIGYLDADENGRIGVEEVEALLHPDFVKLEEPSNIEDVFVNFDKDEDQLISVDDLRTTSESLGFPLSYRQAVLMIQAFDSDNDGKVNLQEFSSIFQTA
ncbi:unnamed protein product [Blepharisma stoltei]|uniref:EF-hand domain-containing protein n=1 Tax=Blepharisma stoltei TaxID=1481888 RepID=A0AAU9IB86_9CILI|nr:unnamed protein product [Blepharisma stoltei]